VNRQGCLRIDRELTTLGSCSELARNKHHWTDDDVQILCAVLRDDREPKRLWLWLWDSSRGVHIIEPTGIDTDALSVELARRFPNA
jgi:hypothetical protein